MIQGNNDDDNNNNNKIFMQNGSYPAYVLHKNAAMCDSTRGYCSNK